MKVSLILNLNISVKCWFTCFCCIKTLKPVQGDRELFVMPNLTFSRFNIVITDKWKRSVFQHLITCVLTKYYINRFFGRCPQNDGRTKSDKTSECELALRRSRLLFFLVGVHVILSFLIGKKRKNNGYEIVITSDTLSHSNNKTLKPVQGDRKLFVIPNCLGFCFTKSRCSLHFVVVRLTFCSFVSVLSLRTKQNPLVSASV